MSERFVALLGYPLGHSISPAFQQAAFDYCGIEARYRILEVPPQRLAEAVIALRAPEALGANVTIPYKEQVIPFLDSIDPQAEAIGAVNTIVGRDGRLIGYNTDADGFARALAEAGFSPQGRRAVILGAGGAARAVATALFKSGVASLVIANRHAERAEALAQLLRSSWAGRAIGTMAWEVEALQRALTDADLVVNATSVGMASDESPLPAETLSSRLTVFDLVYNPLRTRLLRQAEAAGARTIGGLSMLVYQGAASFELWTGQPAPVAVMMQAAEQAIAEIAARVG